MLELSQTINFFVSASTVEGAQFK